MKTGRVFWGAFFVFTGALLLLVRFDVIDLRLAHLWRYWPVVLVLWGIALLVGKRQVKLVIIALMGLALGVLVVSAFTPPWFPDEPREITGLQTQDFVQPWSGKAARASFRFSSGAGTFTLRDTTADLFSAKTQSNVGAYAMDFATREGEEDVDLSLESRHHRFMFGNVTNWAELKLNPIPRWNIKFGVGAARVDVDLSMFDVGRLDIEAGAADVRVKLGDLSENTSVLIHCGVSSVTIEVPETAGCDISVNAPLSSKSFREFQKVGSGSYRTDNFDEAAHKIYVTLEAGVSSLRAVRY